MFLRLTIFFVVLTPLAAFAQLPVARPSEAGISPEGIKHLTAYLKDVVQSNQTSGGVIMMARNDKTVLYESVGMICFATRPD